MKKEISRRSFLKGTAASALTLAAAGITAGAAVAEGKEVAWDAEYDVVVLG